MSDLCPIAVSQDSMEPEFQPETIAESMLLLLKSKQYSDVTFTFPNLPDGIQAHEFCLKARSPVFAKMFRMRKSGNVEGNEIEISECTPERFQQFLEDHSLSDMNFRMDPEVSLGLCFPDTHQEPNIDLEDFCMTLKEIETKTDYCVSRLPDMSEELAFLTMGLLYKWCRRFVFLIEFATNDGRFVGINLN